MSQNRNSISKQVLAWAAVFALVLTIIPYSVADQNSNEYFASWSYELEDIDGDNQNDTIIFTFDVDTNVTDYVDVLVEMEVRDNNGNYVGDEEDNYEIYWTENDTFEIGWFVDDCDDYDDECEGPFDFNFRLYEDVDGYYYYEDNFSESNIYLYETTIAPEGLIQVDNGVLSDDDDGLHNDILFLAHMEDYEVSNVSIELERKVGTQWVDAGNQETDDGEAIFKNMTTGEYRWFAEYDDEDIDEGHTFVFYSTTSDENLGHIGVVEDWDEADDFDDFIFARWSNGSEESINDGVYVELFYEDNNTLYDEDGGNGDGFVVLFSDVEEGNYTFNLYNDTSSGDLMQTGWLHSYGSSSTNHDEWFEDWDYETNDEDGNGIDDVIIIEYNPDTTCNCTVEIEVTMEVFNETGSFVHYDDYEYEINGTNEVWFETDEWSPDEEGNYTFEFYLYAGGWEEEDSFNFSAYLECGSGSYYCDYDEWFEDWDYETEDNDNNGEDDTITIGYDPNTECNCSTDIMVWMYVFYENDTYYEYGNYYYHEINGTEEDWFETNEWSPSEDGNYTFNLQLRDENYNLEDQINFTTYLECNAESNYSSCDYDEWFEDWDYETNDTNNNGVDDTIVVGYNPDTECDCYMDVRVYMDIENADTGNYVDSYYYYHEINGTEEDWFETDDWSPDEDGNYTFFFRLYDENWNYEDNFDFTEFLECAEDCDANEWFESSDYETMDTDSDNLDDTIEVSYNPDTDCDCEVEIFVEMAVYENSSGNWVDYEGAMYTINGTEEDWFTLSWTSHNSTSYDFEILLYDMDDFEDSFWITDVYLYETSGAGGPGDDDEYFDRLDHYTYDADSDGYDDTVEFEHDPDTTCDCYLNVTTVFEFYDNQTGDMVDSFEVEDEIYGDDNDYFYNYWSPSYNGTFDIIVELYDEDGNLEDWEQFNDISLHVRSEGSGDEWFEDWDYDVDLYRINIGYDPNTDCECDLRVWAYIDVYQNQSKIDTISDDYYIFYDEYDWFTQDWTADEEGVYDFRVVLFDGEDGPDNYEDDFWIYDVHLNGDDNGNSESIGHGTDIFDLEEDGYFNDFIGIVTGSDGAYFEIYDENWDLVDSDYSEDELWFSENLDEGWYYHSISVNETGNQLYQEGKFYSYGNSSANNSDIINVHQAVLEDEDQSGDLNIECDGGPCDDAYFIANIGDWDNGVQDVTIDIERYDEESESWEDYATTYTNESGQGAVFDTSCGEYRWEAYYEGNNIDEGYYTVWAHCDDEDDGPHAWFDEFYFTVNDEDEDGNEDSVSVNYSIATDSPDEMDLLLILDIFDESGEMIGTFEEFFTLPANEMIDISFHWSNTHGEGNITFDSVLEHLVDGDTDGEIRVQDEAYEIFYLHVFNEEPAFNIEDVTGRGNVFEGQNIELEVLLEGSNDVVVDWYMGDGMMYQNVFMVYHTYQHSGNYEILVHVYDDDNSVEEYFEIRVRNVEPTILNLMLDEIVNEGDEVSFNIQYEDVPMDMDNITVTWSFPDGIFKGDFVQYTFADDGEFLISVEVSDDDGGSTKEQRMITVQNVAPIFTEFVLPSNGEQGVAMPFTVSATDPGDDTITYTFDFGDGTALLITQTGNASHKFASGDTFEVIICAIDEDGGETCRTEVIPVALLEQLEEDGLPGFGFLGVISALGAITLLRRRTH